MVPRQRIVRERRQYNQWVATETLEDYALRYTATQARRSAFRVGNTAFGPIAFLVCVLDGLGNMHLWTEPVAEVPAAIRKALEEDYSLDYHYLE